MITKKDFMLCEKITEEELYTLKGEWKANIKFDGERIMVVKIGGNIFVINRAGRIKNQIYPEVVLEVAKIEGDFIVDGEIITTDGIFNSLQHRSNIGVNKVERAIKDYPIKYMVFDIINFGGKDLRMKPLKERLEYLFQLRLNVPFTSMINFVEYLDIQEALSFAKANTKEGIVIKNMLSYYQSRRSNDWKKLKLFKEDNFRAISYTINNAGLRVEDDKLNAVQVAGFESRKVKSEIDECGYCDIVIQYLEKTKDNRYRFISFKEVAK